jgi:TolB-like protein
MWASGGQEHRAARANVSTPRSGNIALRVGHARQAPCRREAPDCVWGLAAILVVLGVAGAWRITSRVSRSQPGDSTEAPRLLIVVLPFRNLSGDLTQDYFADGITEDLTSDLSRLAGSFVISRNTAFTYKDTAVDVRQVGRELGVRYVLEGSIRRMGGTVRVNAEAWVHGTRIGAGGIRSLRQPSVPQGNQRIVEGVRKAGLPER